MKKLFRKLIVSLIRIFKKDTNYIDVRKEDEIKRDAENMQEIEIYERKSYSQEGEDLIMEEFLGHNPSGVFIDVGAHHPARYSNTYFFYLKGWRGINVEPNKEGFNLFLKYRPDDINLNCAVSSEKGEKPIYIFSEAALNTLDKNRALSLIKNGWGEYKEECVDAIPLSEIWEKHLGADAKVDFLSVDVEGHEKSVLDSNDWIKFRPTYIIIEALDSKRSVDGGVCGDVHDYLRNIEYLLVGNTRRSFFYKDLKQ